jgi:hypothetical protein
MSFAAITLCVASQRVFIVVVVVYFVIDSVRKLMDTPSSVIHVEQCLKACICLSVALYVLEFIASLLLNLVRGNLSGIVLTDVKLGLLP